MDPFDARVPFHGVERVAEDDVDRNAIAPRVVDRHRRVLQSDGPMREHDERLAFDLRVAVRHRHGGFFVEARQELRLRVAAVIDDRLLQTAEARARVAADVRDAERLDDVDHEVRPAAAAGEDLAGFGDLYYRGRGCRIRGLPGWRLRFDQRGRGHRRGAGRRSLHELPTRNRGFLVHMAATRAPILHQQRVESHVRPLFHFET